ncbi:MAG: low molecular weight phosphatase family protein [Pseudomonadota bacterium]
MAKPVVKAGIPGPDAPKSVLFVCGMNSIRSPMAAAMTRALFPFIVYARSAGVKKGERDHFVDVVMEELDVDISTHNPHTFDELDDENFDLIIALTEEANSHVQGRLDADASVKEFWLTEDPTEETGTREQRLEAYRAVRDKLLGQIKERLGWQPGDGNARSSF